MKPDSRLANKIAGKDFIVTAEYLPQPSADAAAVKDCAEALGKGAVAINVSDNRYGVALSSLAAAVILSQSGIEPVWQLVTRDRNRIALQSDLLGAAALGIKNVLCLSGYHQALIGCPDSANVFDIDSTQLIATVRKMNEGTLIDGTAIKGAFGMLVGAAASPGLMPMELNMLRMKKKVLAGADFIQTQAVFDVDGVKQWLAAARAEGITEKTAVLAGALPLTGAEEARALNARYTDFNIPDIIIERLEKAGNAEAQKKEGIKIFAETVGQLKSLTGLRGIHILCGGNESMLPQIIAAAGL